METILNQQGIQYHQTGDYLLPNIAVGDKKEYHIGIWGQRYSKYLKQNHKVLYYNYLTSGKLYEHLNEVDIRAEKMFNDLVKSFAERENVTEKLKAESPLVWIKKMNNIRSRALELVNNEKYLQMMFYLSEQTICVHKRLNCYRLRSLSEQCICVLRQQIPR